MSDGPHKSLPMRPAWRRVAKCADLAASAPEELNDALISALQKDCRQEIKAGFLDRVAQVFKDDQSCLFHGQILPQLEALQAVAGPGLDRTILDYATQTLMQGRSGTDALETAVVNALVDRASRGARQVEEHYCLKANSPRGQHVRARIEETICRAPVKILARRLIEPDMSPSARPSLKQQGLDDGVRL